MRLLVACGEVERSKETGQCVRRIGYPMQVWCVRAWDVKQVGV